MTPPPADAAKKRDDLRAKYTQAVSSLLSSLETKSQPSYSSIELPGMKVSLQDLKPDDTSFLDSGDCLFYPMSNEERGEFSLHESELEFSEYARELYCSEPFTDLEPGKFTESYIWFQQTRHVFDYLRLLYESSRKGNKRNLDSMEEASRWAEIM